MYVYILPSLSQTGMSVQIISHSSVVNHESCQLKISKNESSVARFLSRFIMAADAYAWKAVIFRSGSFFSRTPSPISGNRLKPNFVTFESEPDL